jgi:SAM-dependent methyltransferase
MTAEPLNFFRLGGLVLFDFLERVRANVDWEKMPGDPMFAGNEDHYRIVGESALKGIVGSLLLANRPDPASILDFACATGRVTRWLRAAFPDAEMDVADLNPEWMGWSARKFGVAGWASAKDLSLVDAPRSYDLIFCGSLVTHIPAEEAVLLLTKFHEWLAPGGIAVVTTHGRRFVANLVDGTIIKYLPNEENTPHLLAGLALDGYAYAPYPGQAYGISVNTLEWLIRVVRGFDARVVTVSENAWDNHQDVLAFQKVG